jgi:hypothetical protein
MPHPGSGDRQLRAHWHLQLLLQVSARSCAHDVQLAELLDGSFEDLPATADEAADVSTALWSTPQLLDRLAQALGELAEGGPGLAFWLDGRTLYYVRGVTIELTNMLATFLRLLIEHLGRPVTFDMFNRAGVSHPTKTKHRLLEILNAKGIHVNISAATMSLTLLAE